jgi:hypothetical protein
MPTPNAGSAACAGAPRPASGLRSLERVLRVYIRHFNQQRPHRALDLRPPDRDSEVGLSPTATVYSLQVRRRDLLGSLLHEYEAAA